MGDRQALPGALCQIFGEARCVPEWGPKHGGRGQARDAAPQVQQHEAHGPANRGIGAEAGPKAARPPVQPESRCA